jgi:hypothetical protein
VVAGGPSLYQSDVTCCWSVTRVSDSSTLIPWGSCAAVRQDEYPYIASFSYNPAVGASRQERVSMTCCGDRTLAPNMCEEWRPSYKGQATVTVVANSANLPPPPPAVG